MCCAVACVMLAACQSVPEAMQNSRRRSGTVSAAEVDSGVGGLAMSNRRTASCAAILAHIAVFQLVYRLPVRQRIANALQNIGYGRVIPRNAAAHFKASYASFKCGAYAIAAPVPATKARSFDAFGLEL
jgi:hypothetical protein